MISLTERAKHIKENVSLIDFLNRLGFKPHGKPAKETMYISMLRESDTNASFSVNDKIGGWYDHGLGKGGNILDFAQLYWKHCSFKEAVERVEQICNLNLNQTNSLPFNQRPRIRLAVKLPNYQIREIKPFGTTEGINAYLKSRGVYDSAAATTKEIHYFIEDEKKKRKEYFGACWQNEAGGWEVRNKYFKGCLGKKAITLIPENPRRLAVFEGYFNYLSWRHENPGSDKSILVLNSLALLEPGIEKAKKYQDIDLYLDHDPAGHKATKDFINALPYAADKSSVYQNFNDYNDKIKAELKAERTQGLIKR